MGALSSCFKTGIIFPCEHSSFCPLSCSCISGFCFVTRATENIIVYPDVHVRVSLGFIPSIGISEL